ncbi:MAG: hypothetical protein H0T85_07230 [Geodermatophilaceae bacterium]|nr:hypothetical protein [Geodermatophilaceae bacterium]
MTQSWDSSAGNDRPPPSSNEYPPPATRVPPAQQSYTAPPAYGGYPPQAPAYGGYPTGAYPPTPYPGTGYPGGYGAPFGAPGPLRPGAALAAAVVSYIQAAFVLMGSFFVLAAGVELTEALVVGVLQLVTVGLLIFGGVQVTGGSGRAVMLVASGSQLVLVVYYLIRITTISEFDINNGDGPWFVFPLFYAVLPAVALGLTLTRAVTDWIALKHRPAGEGPPAAGTTPWSR